MTLSVKQRFNLTPTRMIVFSFLIIIIVGTILLMLPIAKQSGSLGFVDALFTSVSAVCVTGLTVVDIGTDFTLFGQIIVMVLIQIGGLGIMTFSTFFLYLLHRRVSIRNRDVIDSTIVNEPVPNIASFLYRIIILVFIIEGIGVILFTLRWLAYYSFPKALYHSVFHSISAFCNAGFSLYTDSFEGFRTDPWLNFILMSLIILGGLGFIVLLDIKKLFSLRHKEKKTISFHTKVVLAVTLFLIIIGTVILYFIEKKYSFEQIGTIPAFLISLFQSVTARTAGFNTVSMNSLTNGACLILMFLMFVGAAPGSCGGGVKVTTFGILIALFFSKFRGRENAHIFRRTISKETISQVIAIVFSSVLIIGVIFFVLLLTEQHVQIDGHDRGNFIKILFEVFSAFGTVGLSMGITPQLSKAGRILIIFLMFIGRLGPLTLALALSQKHKQVKFRYAEGEIKIG
ncbi:MAG: TrkH family potassium uptake protein [bacterium]